MISGTTGSPGSPRWDRLDSRVLIRLARSIYFSFLSDAPGNLEPCGVVVDPSCEIGRVVFERPVLLPEEEFIALELIRSRGGRGKNRCKL